MRILLITARYYPEPFTITKIAEHLSHTGNEITVLTGKPNYGKWKIYDGYENVSQETVNGIRIIRINEKPRKRGLLGLIRNFLSIKRGFRKKLKDIDGSNFDIVLSHVMSPIFSLDGVNSFCAKYGLPHFHYGFDLWPESLIAAGYCKRKSLLFRIMKRYSIKIYNGCDAIGFVSPSGINYLKKYLHINKPITRIPQPCLTNLPSIEKVEDHKYRNNGKVNLLFCGTVAKFTHLDLIIHALRDDRISRNVVLNIVGSGSDLERIQKLTQELNLKNIVFHGRVAVEETIKYFEEADVLFVPLFDNSYTSKMIPQKLIEYLMYHRPIFGMINGDGRDILQNASKDNFICEQTVDSIKKSLLKIIDCPSDKFIKCGRDNRTFFEASKEYSLDYICTLMNKSMQELCEK